jgi:hypothetical protein
MILYFQGDTAVSRRIVKILYVNKQRYGAGKTELIGTPNPPPCRYVCACVMLICYEMRERALLIGFHVHFFFSHVYYLNNILICRLQKLHKKKHYCL